MIRRMADDDRLTLSIGGRLAAAVRSAAQAAGVSPAQWTGNLLAQHLTGAAAEPAAARPAARPPSLAEALADPAAWHQVTDDSGGYVTALPVGWRSRVWLEPTPAMAYPMVRATSPDGGTTLFGGDAAIPLYVDPAIAPFAPPGMQVRPPGHAVDLLAEWAQFRYGARPGYRQRDLREDPQLREFAIRVLQQQGISGPWLYAARLAAEFADEDGRPVRAVFLGITRGAGQVWVVQVYGVISTADPEPFVPAVLQLLATGQPSAAQAQRNLQERATIDANHAATMETIATNTRISAQGHRERMGNIRQQGEEFQERMRDQRRSHDIAAEGWRERQAAGDIAHDGFMDGLRTGAAQPGTGGNAQQDFINTLREETTVLDAHGYAHQVEAGADRYYHNEHTNTWLGLQEHQDIVEVTGSDDFREGTIQS